MDRRVEYDLQAVRAIHRASRLTAQVHPSNQLAQGGSLSPVPTSSLLKYLGDNVITSIPLGSVVMTERYGGLLVAEVLKAHGVQFIFTLTGGHISPILVASKTAGIRIIDVRHEASAVFAADAVARMSGVPGVAAVTAGPGITNTITAIKNAQMAQSPVVLLGGAAATNVKGRGALQDIDQLAVIRPIVKFAATVSRVRDIVPTLRRAFQEAMSGVPGPVFVELPLDVLYPITEVKAGMGLLDRRRAREVLGSPELEARVVLPEEAKEAGLSVQAYLASKAPSAPVFLEPWASVPSSNATITNTTSATASGSGNGVPKQYVPPPQPPFLVRTVMQYQLAYLYAGAWSGETEDFSPLPVEIPQPAVADVDAVVAALRKAKHPVLLLASQSVLLPPAPSTTSPSSSKTSAEAAAARLSPLRSAIERLGMPTFLAGMARGLLGKNHPLHIRQQRGHALKKADLVILAGTVCDFRMQYGRALPSNAFIVSLNRCEKDVVLNSPLFWKPSVASVSDPAQFLIQLANKFNPLLSPSSASKASPSSAPTPAVDLSVPPPLPPLSGYVTPSSGPTFAFAAWAKTLKDIEATKEAENKRISTAPVTDRDGVEAMMYNPMDVFFALEDRLPDDSVLVVDGGDFVATGAYILRPRGPLSWLDPGAFGTLGVGGGFALGAKLARPNAEVWLVWGDGSAGFSIAEFDSFKRHNAPVIAIVGNDAAWTQIAREQVPIFSDNVACPLSYTDYDVVAKGFGGVGYCVKRSNNTGSGSSGGQDPMVEVIKSTTQRLQEAVTEAQRTYWDKNVPVLMNVHIGNTGFREGSLSV